MMRRVWLTVALCGLLVLAGCQGSTQLLGGEQPDDDTPDTPPATVTETPTQTTSTTTTAATSTHTTTDDQSFNATAFRTAFRADIAATRETRGLPPLNESVAHRRVANEMARELATVQYFSNATAQNSSRFEIRRRLSQAGLTCSRTVNGQEFRGGGFFLQNFYQTYLEVGGNIYYYETESQLARAMTTRMLQPNSTAERQQLSRTVYAAAATTQGVGVHRTSENTVYVVYVVC